MKTGRWLVLAAVVVLLSGVMITLGQSFHWMNEYWSLGPALLFSVLLPVAILIIPVVMAFSGAGAFTLAISYGAISLYILLRTLGRQMQQRAAAA